MKRHYFRIALVLLLVFLFTCSCFGASAKVDSDSYVAIGDSFDVTLSLNNTTITSSSISVQFSSSLEFVSYSLPNSEITISYDSTKHQGVIFKMGGWTANGSYLVLKFRAKTVDKNAYVKVTNELQNSGSILGTVTNTKSIWVVCKTHKYPDWTVKDASCTAAGYKSRICETCGYEEKITLKALGHDVKEYKVTSNSTCKELGIREGVCNRCKQTIKVTIPMKDHEYSDEYVVIQEGTLYQSSLHMYNCKTCGLSLVKQGPCMETDKESGISLVCDEGVFPNKSVLVVEPKDKNSGIKVDGIENISKVYDVYDISVLVGETPVQAGGDAEIQIPISDKYSKNVCLVYLNEDGKIEMMNSWVFDNVLHAKISHFSTYAIVDLTPYSSDEDIKEQDYNLYIEIAEAVVIVVLLALLLRKNKKNEK